MGAANDTLRGHWKPLAKLYHLRRAPYNQKVCDLHASRITASDWAARRSAARHKGCMWKLEATPVIKNEKGSVKNPTTPLARSLDQTNSFAI